MRSHRKHDPDIAIAAGLWATAVLCLGACAPESATEPDRAGESAAPAAVTTFGPFPVPTTVFVDLANTSGVEDGTRAHPYRTLRRAVAAAESGDVVGVAPGVYANEFPADWNRQNYRIDGIRNLKLIGSGVKRTIIRGNHTGSLVFLVNGASVLIQGLTLEAGGVSGSIGGGVQAFGRGDPISVTLRNVILRGNIAANGGAVGVEGIVTLRLVNVLIANNIGTNTSGGVYLGGHGGRVAATFINTTIADNAAATRTGGVLVENDASLRLVNSILWNNQEAQIALFTGTLERVAVSFSDVADSLYPGAGNRSVDPRFVDPAGGNFRIRHTSPVIDAGTASQAPATDILGGSRQIDGDLDCVALPDMGAYEFAPGTACSS